MVADDLVEAFVERRPCADADGQQAQKEEDEGEEKEDVLEKSVATF